MIERTVETPWGPAQTESEVAPGIIFYTTAGHGGYWLSPDRMAFMEAEFPFTTFAGGSWFEEDQDWAAVVIAFPQFFDDRAIWNACRMAEQSAQMEKRHGRSRWSAVLAYVNRTDGGEYLRFMRDRFAESIKGKWELSAYGSGDTPEGWRVHLRRDGQMRCVEFRHYPTQQFYTDDEIEQAMAQPVEA